MRSPYSALCTQSDQDAVGNVWADAEPDRLTKVDACIAADSRSSYKAIFEFTNSNEAYSEGETGGDVEDVTWWVSFPKLGRAGLHVYCTHAAETMGYWAEFWFKKEPWWYEDHPYECTEEQIGAIVRALPAKHGQSLRKWFPAALR